jgi:hypothetical protein
MEDLAHGGTQDRKYPKWALAAIKAGDKLGWEAKRGAILEGLNG